MRLLKKLGKGLLFPPLPVVFMLAVFSGGLLIHVFAEGLEETALAYTAYALSAYALVLVCAGAPRAWRLAGRLRSSTHISRLLDDYAARTDAALRAGLLLNLAFAVFKLLAGNLCGSYWLIALGVYYALLATCRFVLLRRMGRADSREDGVQGQYRACRMTGFLLLALNVVMSAIILQVVRDNQAYSYPGTMIYAFGAYAFYSVIMAGVNLIRRRHDDTPLLSAVRCLNLATALVSVFSLQTALLSTFGAHEPEFRLRANAAFGAVICAGIFLIAVTMVYRSSRALRRLRG